MNTTPFELGVHAFVDYVPDPLTGDLLDPAQRMRDMLEAIELADRVGLDVFGIGEHHRADFLASSPATILAAAAARTKTIRLTSSVTVLSSDDPVRVFQQFATLDLISNGRAEIMAGRGSFIESYPLFGYNLRDYDVLFSEKLDLLLKIREAEKVMWAGKHRASLINIGVYPRPVQNPLPVWIAVGGTPESVIRAGHLGLPLALAIIGGMPEQFMPLVQLYREAGAEAGHPAEQLKVSINSQGFIAEDSMQAADIFFPPFSAVMNQIGRERGWRPMSRQQFEALRSLRGAYFVGSPDEIIEKILFQHELFGHQRLLLQMSIGAIPHDKLLNAIELLGTKVAPIVRQEIARRTSVQLG